MICLHVIVDNCSDAQLDRALLYCQRVNAPMINIAGGAQLDRAMAYVERVRAALPTIKIFFRNLNPEDTGIWTKLNPEAWFNNRIMPRLAWAQRNHIIHVTDNESSGDDDVIRRYVAWQVDVVARLHAVGLHAGYGRFASGNIAESQYVLLKPMFDAAQDGDYFTPNEYVNAPGKSSGGHLQRYKLAWQAAGRELPTAIGEFAIAVDYKSDKGYRTIGLSDKDYGNFLLETHKAWYAPNHVNVFLYAIGGYTWPSFQPGEETLTTLENAAAADKVVDMSTKPIISIVPKPEGINTFQYVTAKKGRNLRFGPGTNYNDINGTPNIEEIYIGDFLKIANEQKVMIGTLRWVWAEIVFGKNKGQSGWAQLNADEVTVLNVHSTSEIPGINMPPVTPVQPQSEPAPIDLPEPMAQPLGSAAPTLPTITPVEQLVRYKWSYTTSTEVMLLPSNAKLLQAAGISLEAILEES